MTGPQHFREAEQHLHYAAGISPEADGWMGDATRYHLAVAQVHAMLAQAAATAEPSELDQYDVVDGSTCVRMERRGTAWTEAFEATEPGS